MKLSQRVRGYGSQSTGGHTARIPDPAIVITSIISTQVGATVAVRLFHQIGPGGTVTLRIGFAALILTAVWRPRIRGYSRREYGIAILFGLTLAAMNFTFYEGLTRIPLGLAVTLEFVGPLGVAIASSRNRRDFVWVVLAATGIALLAPWGGLHLNILRMGLVLIAGGFWAAYILLSRRVGQSFSESTGLVIALMVGGIVLVPVGIVTAGTSLLHIQILAAGVVLATLSSVVTYSFELSVLRRMPTRVFGVLMSLEPAVAALLGLLILGQAIGLRAGIAIICVVTASAGASRFAGEDLPATIE